jgi:hypothetical protein
VTTRQVQVVTCVSEFVHLETCKKEPGERKKMFYVALCDIQLPSELHHNVRGIHCMGRDSSVGLVTRYGLDGPRIEYRSGARFSLPVQTGPGTYPASCTGSLSRG